MSGKLGDVDGVSLEVDKWIDALGKLGHEVFTIAGHYRSPLQNVARENQFLLPSIRFGSESQLNYERHFFPYFSKLPPHDNRNSRNDLIDQMMAEGAEVGAVLHQHVQDNDIDVLVGENTNAMPMTLLGGIGMYHVATEKRVATIFHHHDFWWERSRFSNAHIEALLNRIMPPVDLGLEHVVISSYAAHILSSLKRVQPHIVPNCEDFEHAVTRDDYNADFRAQLGFREKDILVVQPTRVVRRKRIEDSVRLVAALGDRFPHYRDRLHYIISLYQGDEPDENYVDEIRALSAQLGVQIHFISDRVASVRGQDGEGRKLYTNRDVLVNADLVTYLPIWEGFGNALLEALAARVPVVTTTYLVYKTDIKVIGVRNIEIRDRYEEGRLVIEDDVLDSIDDVITHPEERAELVEENFETAKREFGLQTLSDKLSEVFAAYGDEIRASRMRIRKSKARYSV
ncbi:MAG TPA: glycosyltransferase family 4 protein [Spirochaetia bacterium]|nr:glycosyltransferase family 4 protein [Spirochaetia bacterium]